MTETPETPSRRWRWRRMIGGGVALGLAGVAAGWLLEPRGPTLVADLPDYDTRGNIELGARVRQRFPAGRPVAVMADALARDGFTISDGLARWDAAGMPCRIVANIRWRESAGRVVTTDANIARACL